MFAPLTIWALLDLLQPCILCSSTFASSRLLHGSCSLDDTPVLIHRVWRDESLSWELWLLCHRSMVHCRIYLLLTFVPKLNVQNTVWAQTDNVRFIAFQPNISHHSNNLWTFHTIEYFRVALDSNQALVKAHKLPSSITGSCSDLV